jgi:hypothetical protein
MYIFKNRVRDSCAQYKVCEECEKKRYGRDCRDIYYMICVKDEAPVNLCSRCFRKLQKKINKL